MFAIKYLDEKSPDDEAALMVKFLERLPDGGLKIISASDNPAFRTPIELNPDQAERVKIIGRIVHVQGLVGRRKGTKP